jgi:DNA-binding CsgD family transcriptional regulator
VQLLGRAGEVDVLRAALDAVADGESRVLVVSGEPGIGKTRLVEVAVDEARRRRVETLTGRATELEGDVPLGLFTGVLPPDLLDPDRPPVPRWRLAAALTARLTRRPARPVLVALDDAHWADPASLELLETLVRRPPPTPHVLLVALRPGPALDVVLTAARSAARRLEAMPLAPLDRETADQMLGPGVAADDRARLFESSGGNPLLLTELARSSTAGSSPRGLLAAVGLELQRLSEDARRLAGAAALLGDPFWLDLAGRVADLDRPAWLDAVDELVADGLLVASPTGSREFRFRHPAVRTAVHDGVPPGARITGHARAAAALSAAGAPATARARHLVHTVAPGDLDAARVLRSAATLTRPRAPSIAADWLLAARLADPPRRLGDVTDLAEALVQSGRLAEALAAAEEGLTLAVAEPGERMPLDLVAASVERQLGRHDSARRRLERALADVADGPSRTELLAAVALSAYQSGDYEAVHARAHQLREDPTRDRVLGALGQALLAMSLRFRGDLEASDREADAAVAAVELASDAEVTARAELATAIPWALMAMERLAAAAAVSRRASALARAAGNLGAAVALALPDVLSLALLGRLEEAEVAADQAEVTARLAHNAQATQWALWTRAWVLLERGRVVEARAAAIESVELAGRLDDSALVTIGRTVLGAVLLADGEPARAADLLGAYDLEPGWTCRWAPRLVAARLAAGDRTGAARAAERARQLASSSALAGASAAAHRAGALVALERGDVSVAHEHALAAAADARSIEAEHDLALALLLAARASPARDQALAHLDEAHRLAVRCGARRTEEEAVRELRRLGRRIGRGGPRAPGATGAAALSPRELEIAGLVAQGRTNRDIADRLFLSEKTVESHLTNAFAKLGVSSRAALAAEVSAHAPDQGSTGSSGVRPQL